MTATTGQQVVTSTTTIPMIRHRLIPPPLPTKKVKAIAKVAEPAEVAAPVPQPQPQEPVKQPVKKVMKWSIVPPPLPFPTRKLKKVVEASAQKPDSGNSSSGQTTTPVKATDA